MPDRPWSRLSADLFYNGLPVIYSVTLRREPPDALRGSLRARRTLFEGVMLALAEKTGRRPSMAEQASDTAMDAAESLLSLGKPAFRMALMAGLFADRSRVEQAESARHVIEAGLRTRGLTAQRLFYIPERALHYFQPGGIREQAALWAMQDLRLKREKLSRDVKVDDPLVWLNQVVAKVYGETLDVTVTGFFENPRRWSAPEKTGEEWFSRRHHRMIFGG